jgi:hypothetical protein
MFSDTYGFEGSYALGFRPEDEIDLLGLEFGMDLNNNSAHTEATLDASFDEGPMEDLTVLNDSATRPSFFIDTTSYSRPRSASDGGTARTSNWSSVSNTIRNSSLGPLFGFSMDVTTNSAPRTCCTCTCTCSYRRCSPHPEIIDDPLLYRPIQEVQTSSFGAALPMMQKANPFRSKRNRSLSNGRRRKQQQKEIVDPVSDLKFDGLRVSPPGSPGKHKPQLTTKGANSSKENSPLAKKIKKVKNGIFPSKTVAATMDGLRVSPPESPRKFQPTYVGRATTAKENSPPLAKMLKKGIFSIKNASSGGTSSFHGKSLPDCDLLVSKATDNMKKKSSSCSPSSVATTTSCSTSRSNATTTSSSAPKKRIRRKVPTDKTYADVNDLDVLLGRGGRTNGHHGNVIYRHHILKLQKAYKDLSKGEKLEMSKNVVKWVRMRGGRFLARDDTAEGRPYYEATDCTARAKVSQALREDHTPEGRELKKSRTRTFAGN